MLLHLFWSVAAMAQEAGTGAVSVAPGVPAIGPSGLASVNWTLIFAVLWGLAETLALIPAIKSNSVFTLVFNVLKSIHDKLGLDKPA